MGCPKTPTILARQPGWPTFSPSICQIIWQTAPFLESICQSICPAALFLKSICQSIFGVFFGGAFAPVCARSIFLVFFWCFICIFLVFFLYFFGRLISAFRRVFFPEYFKWWLLWPVFSGEYLKYSLPLAGPWRHLLECWVRPCLLWRPVSDYSAFLNIRQTTWPASARAGAERHGWRTGR